MNKYIKRQINTAITLSQNIRTDKAVEFLKM